jgi:hypothetical protein
VRRLPRQPPVAAQKSASDRPSSAIRSDVLDVADVGRHNVAARHASLSSLRTEPDELPHAIDEQEDEVRDAEPDGRVDGRRRRWDSRGR